MTRKKQNWKHLRQTRWSLIPALSLALFGAPRAEAQPRMPTHVACVGDSITEGFAASSPAKAYPAVLQGLFGAAVQVHNFGHSGTTMLSDGFGDAPYEDVSEYKAAQDFVSNAGANAVVDVIIMLGTNDSKPFNWTPSGKPKNDQQYLTDYRAMVAKFLSLTPKPVVYLALPLATGSMPCCQINGVVIHDEEIPLIQQLAAEQKLPTIDLNTPTTGHPEYFVDGVHPTDSTYALVAQLMYHGLLRVPRVALTAPQAGALLQTGSAFTITAQASGDTVGISSVEFFQGATSLGKSMSAPFSVPWTVSNGSSSLHATAIDSTSASATSDSVTVTGVVGQGESGNGGNSGMPGANGGASGASNAPAGASNSAGANNAAGASQAGSGFGASGAAARQPSQASGSPGCALSGAGGRAGSRFLLSAMAVLTLLGMRRRTQWRRATQSCSLTRSGHDS